ncbi:hypothetical protein GCM10027040_29290 [Halomonas shantousis]
MKWRDAVLGALLFPVGAALAQSPSAIGDLQDAGASITESYDENAVQLEDIRHIGGPGNAYEMRFELNDRSASSAGPNTTGRRNPAATAAWEAIACNEQLRSTLRKHGIDTVTVRLNTPQGTTQATALCQQQPK